MYNHLPLFKSPINYKPKDLSFGEKVFIYILKPEQKFCNLFFSEEGSKITSKLILDENLTLTTELEGRMEIIKKAIIDMGEIYSCYGYLFSIIGEEIYLVSLTLKRVPLSHDTLLMVAKELQLETLKPVWKGVYTSTVLEAFLEDTFIQKS